MSARRRAGRLPGIAERSSSEPGIPNVVVLAQREERAVLFFLHFWSGGRKSACRCAGRATKADRVQSLEVGPSSLQWQCSRWFLVTILQFAVLTSKKWVAIRQPQTIDSLGITLLLYLFNCVKR